jgi:hypothetical protein
MSQGMYHIYVESVLRLLRYDFLKKKKLNLKLKLNLKFKIKYLKKKSIFQFFRIFFAFFSLLIFFSKHHISVSVLTTPINFDR